MTRQAPLIAELVNLATAHWRGGASVQPPAGEELAATFAAQLGDRTAAALRAVPDAGRRLAELATELRQALLAEQPADQAARINAMIRRYGAQPYLASSSRRRPQPQINAV
ncbi:hypothetical protein ABZ907_37725 [Nonomuraea wenchangensis]